MLESNFLIYAFPSLFNRLRRHGVTIFQHLSCEELRENSLQANILVLPIYYKSRSFDVIATYYERKFAGQILCHVILGHSKPEKPTAWKGLIVSLYEKLIGVVKSLICHSNCHSLEILVIFSLKLEPRPFNLQTERL